MSTNAELVRTALTKLFIEGDADAIDQYWTPGYIQHNPLMSDGTDGLRAGIAAAPDGKVGYEMGVMVAEGDYVMVHGRYTGWAPTPLVVIDIFRIEHGKIAEHWDVTQPEVPADQTASGRPMF